MSKGRLTSVPTHIPESRGITPGLSTFAGGKLWTIGYPLSGTPTLYTMKVG
jgi:hypothetical protein